MKLKEILIFKAGLLVLCLGLFLLATSGALAVVWVRGQTSSSAERVLILEKQLLSVEHKIAHLEARVAAIHSPEYLKSRIGDGLRQPRQTQIVWMNSSSLQEPRYVASYFQSHRSFVLN